MTPKEEITCFNCKSHYFIHSENPLTNYCPYCGKSISETSTLAETVLATSPSSQTEISFVEGLAPDKENILFSIGPYQALKAIGKGGMGEVHLVYDTTCGRRIALKRVRTDLEQKQRLLDRFLKEARITSQLTHPSIIPIYAIHIEAGSIFYTMPYVKGETLRAILRRTRRQEKMGEPLDHLGGSIPALARTFINICQAIAYAHAYGVLHRDIKPENIMIGSYGEVMILDWGLAKMLKTKEEFEAGESKEKRHTGIGKIVGTISYMAPERAMGSPSTAQTDIYSLGVILYQILTLHLPFKRGKLAQFRKNIHKEKWTDPTEVSPYREVPPMLAKICKRCLHPHPGKRYPTVDAMIRDLENYIEGRSDWFETTRLDTQKKSDWEFQENVLFAEHVAITRATETSDWVSLMISKRSFAANVKLETRVKLGNSGHGVGFLLCIPEITERRHLNDGYCLWLGSNSSRATKLLRSTVEVLSAPEVYLEQDMWVSIRIEKVENTVHLWMNDTLQFTYYSHLPLVGTHIGFLSRDADFEMDPLTIFQGNLHVTVNCLAVPDAFLAHKDFTTALSEYRRIAYSFPGRAEGREALFRAGVTLLEQGRSCTKEKESIGYYEQALAQFENLHNTPGAPLEYLGKGLVYKEMGNLEEEVKCYTFPFRRYRRHPMLTILQEQVIHRMHECSRHHRSATYALTFLAVRHIQDITDSNLCQKLFKSLQGHWETPQFIHPVPESETDEYLPFAISLAFWLNRPHFLQEMVMEILKSPKIMPEVLSNALFSMTALGPSEPLTETLEALSEPHTAAYHSLREALEATLLALKNPELAVKSFKELFPKPSSSEALLSALALAEIALDKGDTDSALALTSHFANAPYTSEELFYIDTQTIWALLQAGMWQEAEQKLHRYPAEILSSESTPLHYLYGLYLLTTEGEEIAAAHFGALFDVAHPRSWNLATHYITGKIGPESRWMKTAFFWEKKQLYRSLSLYERCLGNIDQAKRYLSMSIRQ